MGKNGLRLDLDSIDTYASNSSDVFDAKGRMWLPMRASGCR